MISTFIASLVLTSAQITPLHAYNGVHSGVEITIELPEKVEAGHLVMLDHKNQVLTTAIEVVEGTYDLLKTMPYIQGMTRAAWLQLLVNGKPVGAPLVVQPLLSRTVPIVEQALRADGETTYTRITGWRDEAEDDGIEGPLVSGWRMYIDKLAVIETSEGAIHVALRPDVAPNTVWNFRELAKGGLYRHTTFHRIVPMTSKGFPFVIQGGDPTGTGSGGPGWWLPIEQSSLQHDTGIISMARADDPDSAGSQFFICLSREGTARLDGQYCAFGETIEGQEVIRAIGASPLEDPATGKPIDPPKIQTIRLVPAAPRYPSR